MSEILNERKRKVKYFAKYFLCVLFIFSRLGFLLFINFVQSKKTKRRIKGIKNNINNEIS